jgi:hypothetical protein
LVTCQLTGDDDVIADEPMRIANAAKGDLFLSPGSSLGLVGAILGALRPSQHYSHMGIFVDDGLSIRHATGSSDRLEQHPNGSILGKPAPSDGFEPDALRYGWPGTLTQTVADAYAASQPGPPDTSKWLEDPDTPDEHGNPMRFKIDALSFDAVPVLHYYERADRVDVQTRPPLLVKPCPHDEINNAWIRPLLHRIADAAAAIRGHYRFFAYTDATIALSSNFFGPPMYERTVEVRDPDTGRCEQVEVSETIPVMCSSLIWAAIEIVRAQGVTIQLEWNEEPPSSRCTPAVPADGPPPDGPAFEDGLYVYATHQRQDAGKALYDKVHGKVTGALEDASPGLLGIAGGIAVDVLLTALSAGTLGALALALGVAASELDVLAAAFSDMPDDVANQVCNAFASDDCSTSATDSTAWQAPGSGRSVSPDDIALYWDGAGDPGGPYGYNVPAVIRPARRVRRPPAVWKLSDGVAPLSGRVFVNGWPAAGARVKVACRDTVVDLEGSYTMMIPTGRYLATAGLRDPISGWWWEAERVVEVVPGGTFDQDFELQPPRRAFRRMVLAGRADLVDEVVIGHDWVSHPLISGRYAYLGPFHVDDPNQGLRDKIRWSSGISDVAIARLELDFTRTAYADDGEGDSSDPYSVEVDWLAGIWDPDEHDPDIAERGHETLHEDSTGHWTVSLDSGLWAQRVHLDFTVENQRMP